ncbi:MAG: tetratricopeptide repeat protein, partial [Planctomycetota bacterium]
TDALEQDLPVRTLDLLGILLEETGDTEAAIAHLRRVHRVHPGDFWVNYHLAHFNLRLDEPRHAEAIRFCTAAVALNPSPGGHNNLGAFLDRMGRHDEAVASFRQAIRLDPDCAMVHDNLGVMLGRMGRHDEAIASFREAIRLDASLARAHTNLGCSLYEKGLLDEAIAESREAIRLDPKNTAAHNLLGTILCDKLGQYDAAIAEFRAAILLDPEVVLFHANLGNALARKGSVDEAIVSYREAIRLDPEHAGAHGLLGSLLIKMGLFDEALKELREAARLEPSPRSHNRLGVLLCDRFGQYDAAIAEFRAAIVLDPQMARAHRNLGLALAKKGLRDEAIASLEEAVRVDPEYFAAHFTLGIVFSRKGLVDKAIASFREAVQVDPDNVDPDHPFVLCHLGLALRSKAEFEEALIHLRRAHEQGSRQPGWPNPSAMWVGDCERYLKLSKRLPAVLAGEDPLRDTQERIDAAQLCFWTKRYPDAVRLYGEAFAEDPDVADDLLRCYRYQAACAAVLAGSGQGDESLRSRWREQALAWLRAGLVLRAAQAKGREFPGALPASQVLRHWLNDPDLSAVRDEAELAKLPEAEQEQWRAFWKEVADVLEAAQ